MPKNYRRHAYESTNWIIGPMSANDFFNQFLPLPNGSTLMPSSKDTFLAVPFEPNPGFELYQLLTAALNSLLTKFKCTATSTGSSKPCIGLYAIGREPQLLQESGTAITDFGDMELFIEVNTTKDDDPCCDTSPELIDFDFAEDYDDLSKTDQAKVKTLGRSVHHVSQIFARQHRLHVYSLTVSGPMVRFIGWDRAGAIVSQAFDCRDDPSALCRFLWHLERVNLAQRGFDATVEKDSNRLYCPVFTAAIEDRVCFELGIDRQHAEAIKKALHSYYDPEQLSIVSVSEGDTVGMFCITRPLGAPPSVAGRGTRGYWSFDIATQEMCFLKDAWRATPSGLELEGDIARELFENSVMNVPEVSCHGDVVSENKSQRTLTQDFVSASWVKRSLTESKLRQRIVERVHYRMVSTTLGCSLHEHDNLRELLSAARDMYHAVIDAEKKCQRLHRDISANNVILVRDRQTNTRRAVVIDWELSIKTERLKEGDHKLCGTLRFMSYRLFQHVGTTPHCIHDDLESIFWVISWYLLLYYSTFTAELLAVTLQEVFDSSVWRAGVLFGGSAKLLELLQQVNLERGLGSNRTIMEWITRYAKYLTQPITARPGDPPQDPRVLDLDVFGLAETAPVDVLKKTPDWTKLKAYHQYRQSESHPETSASSSASTSTQSMEGGGASE